MSRSPSRVVLLCCAMALATAVLRPAQAQPPTVSPAGQPAFERVDPSTIDVARVTKMFEQHQDRTVSALVRLEAPAAVQRRSSDRSLGRAAARRATEQSQRGVLQRLSKLNVKVDGRLSTVMNAVQVHLRTSDLARVRALPGVAEVEVARIYEPTNSAANAYTGVGRTWQGLGLTGRGQSIAVIDSGIDYTHADFGGPGTTQAYRSNDSTRVEPGTFPTPKVVAGYDLVGDEYNPSCPRDECPLGGSWLFDDDPLDCSGHGTHVAGTAAGGGVTSAGATYRGPYDEAALTTNFAVEPGAAPEATLHAYKVFGCKGGTESTVVVGAIDRAVAAGVDVINLSLGSSLGTARSMETIAIKAATEAGALVVVAGGNDGDGAYLIGGPGTADEALSVAAVAAQSATLPGVQIAGAVTATAVELTGAGLSGTVRGRIVDVGLGCAEEDYTSVQGAVVVATRGRCALLDRPRLAAASGAAALVLINDDDSYPPVVGPLPGAAIPFVGARPADGPTLRAARGQLVTLSAAAAVPDPTYGKIADLSSAGPRRGDSAPKPDLAAPGVSIPSAAVGTGTGRLIASGTSMSSPHVAGIAALVAQAHPSWTPQQLKAVLMSTASPGRIVDGERNLMGAGLVQARIATASSAYAWTTSPLGTLAFGMAELGAAYRETRQFKITNTSLRTATYDLSSTARTDGVVVTVSPRAVAVPPGETRTIAVTLELDEDAIAGLPGALASNSGRLATIQGSVLATPRGRVGLATLRMGYLLVPMPLSDVRAPVSLLEPASGESAELPVTNAGPHSGTASLFAWLLSDPAGDIDDPDSADLVSFGVRSVPGAAVGEAADDRLVVFAVNLAEAASTHVVRSVSVTINELRPAKPDYYTITVDAGLATGSSFSGRLLALTFANDGSGPALVDAWSVTAPANGSTILMPVRASRVGVDASYPLMELSDIVGVNTRDPSNRDSQDLIYRDSINPATARFDAFDPVVSQGDIVGLDPGESAAFTVSVDATRLSRQAVLGWLVVTPDDAGGWAEADRVRLVRSTSATARGPG